MAMKLLAAAAVLILHVQDQVQGLQVQDPMGNPQTKCIDKHTKCLEWAKDGECKSNPTWMHPNCMMSCGQCAAIGGDSDITEDCTKWAKDGECDVNYTWMFFNCPKSCEHTGKRVAAWRSGSMVTTEL